MQTPDPLDQRGTEPAGQLGPAVDELAPEPQLLKLVLPVAALVLDVGNAILRPGSADGDAVAGE
ncbi:hypothetical protein QFZ56_007488 [Streptomyces achromogenes]|uniref:Uncharacterized protein n=1 Tax=Streptomyces achromogenes TaxID=67255 RepID=A0ABU0QCY4_STRAH|nr:hypothetical protein [Streptomyces achromogenes]MDQ0688525.1 hypothetical protein [Streptomyces achromogenes]